MGQTKSEEQLFLEALEALSLEEFINADGSIDVEHLSFKLEEV